MRQAYTARPKCQTSERLFGYMVERARYRDRQYFCSDSTAAKALGVSRHTILRARAKLEAAGRIERCGTKRFGHGKTTIKYALKGRRIVLRESSQQMREYLRSSVWAHIRCRQQQILPESCEVCGEPDRLHLHHVTYQRWGGFERPEDLIWLCPAHHQAVHRLRRVGFDLDVCHLIVADKWARR